MTTKTNEDKLQAEIDNIWETVWVNGSPTGGTDDERALVAFAKLVQQVRNGGFGQWSFNGYADKDYEIGHTALYRLPTENPHLNIAIRLMERAVTLNDEMESEENATDADCWEDEISYFDYSAAFNKLNNKFYDMDYEALYAEVLAWWADCKKPQPTQHIPVDLTPYIPHRPVKDCNGNLIEPGMILVAADRNIDNENQFIATHIIDHEGFSRVLMHMYSPHQEKLAESCIFTIHPEYYRVLTPTCEPPPECHVFHIFVTYTEEEGDVTYHTHAGGSVAMMYEIITEWNLEQKWNDDPDFVEFHIVPSTYFKDFCSSHNVMGKE